MPTKSQLHILTPFLMVGMELQSMNYSCSETFKTTLEKLNQKKKLSYIKDCMKDYSIM